jgi:3D (Asp-Asp-Asp) domain-containing protein
VPLVFGRRESRPVLALVTLCAVAAAALMAGGGAGATSQTVGLGQQQDNLAGRTRAAVLGLYSLDTQLARARARLESLHARAGEVERQRERVRTEIAVARGVLVASQRHLADRLRLLYEQGEPDAIAVVLGATSLQDAVSRLDELERTAHLDRQAIAESSGARKHLAALAVQLAGRAAEIQRLEAAAARTTAALAAARTERVRYIDELRREQRLKAAQVAHVAATARRSATRSEAIQAGGSAAAPAPAEVVPAAAAPGTITVTATGYSLAGTTAMGLPAGWGVVAVDPAVIPLGTRLSIPGYGEGVAADTGEAVQGAAIDLWFPTEAQALAWGRRVVTVTLH